MGKEPLDVPEALRSLIKHIPLLGFMIIKMKWSFSDKVPTAGINKDFVLLLNKKYMESLSSKEVTAILKHEALHVVHRHFERLQDVKHPEIAELAREISINQYIDDLPNDDHPTVEKFGLNRKESLETYYKELVKIAKKNPKKVKGACSKNPLKGDADDMNSGSNQKKGEQLCKDAEDFAKSIGKEGGDMFEKVEILPTNYKAKIKALVACQPSTTKKRRSNKRRSKRFARSPGTKFDLEFGNVIFGLDTSGSMGKKELSEAVDVVKKIRNICNDVIMIQGDTTVTAIEKVQKNIKELEIKGRGGTDLRPIIEKAKDYGFPKTPLVMFTDGEIWDYPSVAELKNSVWVFTQENTAKNFAENRPGIEYAIML